MNITDRKPKAKNEISNRLSNAEKKAAIHLYESIIRDDCRRAFAEIREKFGLPEDGFNDTKAFEEWIKELGEEKDQIIGLLVRELFNLSIEFNLTPLTDDVSGYKVLFLYLFSRFEIYDMNYDLNIGSLCKNFDVDDVIDDQYLRKLDKTHPIIIRIHPQANLEDIKNHLDKTYADILRRQLKFKQKSDFVPLNIEAKRVKNKDLLKIGDVAYKHQNNSRNEIREKLKELIAESKDIPGQSELGKIISLEKKRRRFEK